ncbi:MAG TPA: hypothetical protein VGL09_00040 [Methylomirabilota bacterium]
MLAEPDIALTDWGLAVEAALMTVFVRAAGRAAVRVWWTVFFSATALGALLGGVVHGFLTDPTSVVATVLWRLTLLVIGVTTLAAWAIGAYAFGNPIAVTWIVRAAVAVFAGYAVVVLLVIDAFAVAIAHYVPAALFLLAALIHSYRRWAAPPILAGVIGLLLLFVGSSVQLLHIGVHPVYFTHNALYHAIEGVALLGLYGSARWMVASSAT